MNPSDIILRKALVAANIPSKDWSAIHASLRNRAFFMSRVTEQKLLYAARQGVASILDGAKDKSELRRDLRKMISDGMRPTDPKLRGTIQDIFTKQRLDTMIDTNVRQAKGYANHLQATKPGALKAFPGYELIRVRQSRQPRDWQTRWNKAAREVNFEGVARNGAMIALKTSPIWVKLSVFGNPFPPFDWGSGMGLDDVERGRCKALGLVGEGIPEQEPPKLDLNGHLEAQVPFKNNKDYQDWHEAFGDQLKIDKTTGTLKWREEVFKENFESGHFNIKLGCPSDDLIRKMNEVNALKDISASINGKQLSFSDSNWLDVKRTDGTDHRTHFGNEPEHPENIPLEKNDIELMPSIWRNPDQVRKIAADRFELRIEALDGISDYVLQIALTKSGGPKPWSFFRTKKRISHP